jgi:hypothetical protein
MRPASAGRIRVRNPSPRGCTDMTDDHTYLVSLSVDEAWIVDWATEGVLAIERFLAKHAAFADFLRARNGLDWCDGDGCADV